MAQTPTREILGWPEFQALAKRLGIPLEKAFTTLTINIPVGGVVTYSMNIVAENNDPKHDRSCRSAHGQTNA